MSASLKATRRKRIPARRAGQVKKMRVEVDPEKIKDYLATVYGLGC